MPKRQNKPLVNLLILINKKIKGVIAHSLVRTIQQNEEANVTIIVTTTKPWYKVGVLNEQNRIVRNA
ncbi:MAG: hypothetical protein JXA50_09375 [Deltaproteobacteria bacterium]|nr:hypothetical protein [Deltaproteobacteria bacterium]